MLACAFMFASAPGSVFIRHNSELVCFPKVVFTWRRASPLCRDPASQLNSLSKFVFVYERSASLGGLEIFHINALKRAGHPI